MVSSQPMPAVHHDPIARYAWIAMLIAAVWINVVTYQPPVQAQGADPGVIIYQTTPTPALPTPAPGSDPAIVFALPTPALAAPEPPPHVAQDGAGAAEADDGDYLANVGAQAPHSPRGDAPTMPPAFQAGMVAEPVNADNEIIIIDPNPAPPLAGIAASVPPISADQALILAARESTGCPVGQTFYPRTGCHLPGSGGPQPGAVGEARP